MNNKKFIKNVKHASNENNNNNRKLPLNLRTILVPFILLLLALNLCCEASDKNDSSSTSANASASASSSAPSKTTTGKSQKSTSKPNSNSNSHSKLDLPSRMDGLKEFVRKERVEYPKVLSWNDNDPHHKVLHIGYPDLLSMKYKLHFNYPEPMDAHPRRIVRLLIPEPLEFGEQNANHRHLRPFNYPSDIGPERELRHRAKTIQYLDAHSNGHYGYPLLGLGDDAARKWRSVMQSRLPSHRIVSMESSIRGKYHDRLPRPMHGDQPARSSHPNTGSSSSSSSSSSSASSSSSSSSSSVSASDKHSGSTLSAPKSTPKPA